MLKKLFRRTRRKAPISSAFQYQPLDAATKEIRLLLLQPACKSTDPIRCIIKHTHLQDAGEYFALSYTWGDAGRRRPIFLNGCEFEVTLNLKEFLRRRHVSDEEQIF